MVVSDRFTLANVVYQGHAGGLSPADLWTIGKVATGGLEPDLTLIFDLSVEGALARRARDADRMEERAVEFHNRVRSGFLFEAGMHPEKFRLVEADSDIEAVQRVVRREVARLLIEKGWTVRAEG